MCKDALHLGHAFRHCLTIGLPQVGRVYARGNRFAASARTRQGPGRGPGAEDAGHGPQAEHAFTHGSSRIPHDSVRQGMLGWNVHRGMLGATKLARRTLQKRHEHALAHANAVTPALSRAESHPCAGACSTGPEGRFFSPAHPPSMPLRTALPSMPPCTKRTLFQAKPCAGACSGQAGGSARQTRATSSPWSESQARRPRGTLGRRRPRQQGTPRNRR